MRGPDGVERELARPEEQRTRLELRARMADGSHLAVVSAGPERDLLVLVQLTIVRPESVESNR